jgi:hypothetical protein
VSLTSKCKFIELIQENIDVEKENLFFVCCLFSIVFSLSLFPKLNLPKQQITDIS